MASFASDDRRATVRLAFALHFMTRLGTARRLQTGLGDLYSEVKPRSRVSLARISGHRANPPQADKPVKGVRAIQSLPEFSSVRPEPFKHVEVPIGDRSDPQDVAEFEHIIYRSLREKESAMKPLRFEQEEITLKDRNLMIDAICRMQYKLQLATNSFYRFIGILDRYLTVAQVKKAKLMVVGCASFLIASKIEDIYPARSQDLIQLSGRVFTQQELFAQEITIINAIQFDTTFGTPLFYLTQFMRISDPNREALFLARYLLEICQTSERMFGMASAMLASVAVMMARVLKGQEKWPRKLAGYTGFTAEQLAPLQVIIHSMLVERDREETRFMRRKYSSDLFLCVANIKIPTRLE
jgi:hypothetical protein